VTDQKERSQGVPGDQELRLLVREAIARHAAEERRRGVPGDQAAPAASSGDSGPGLFAPPFAILRQHPSHGLFAVPAGADIDGPCVIEPTVQCNHCGYCKSYGH
jgi:hypothetical protein